MWSHSDITTRYSFTPKDIHFPGVSNMEIVFSTKSSHFWQHFYKEIVSNNTGSYCNCSCRICSLLDVGKFDGAIFTLPLCAHVYTLAVSHAPELLAPPFHATIQFQMISHCLALISCCCIKESTCSNRQVGSILHSSYLLAAKVRWECFTLLRSTSCMWTTF